MITLSALEGKIVKNAALYGNGIVAQIYIEFEDGDSLHIDRGMICPSCSACEEGMFFLHNVKGHAPAPESAATIQDKGCENKEASTRGGVRVAVRRLVRLFSDFWVWLGNFGASISK